MTSLLLRPQAATGPPAATSAPDVTTAMSSGPLLQVDLSAVASNTRLLSARTTGALMAVVKADGFGHGAEAVARTALVHGASSLGVTTVAEGLALRAVGIEAPVLSWLNPVGADFVSALRAGLDLAVPSDEHLRAVSRAAAAAGVVAQVHLHADVGMARDGAPAQQWSRLCHLAAEAEEAGLLRVVGVMGHLGCADQPEGSATTSDLEAYRRALGTARAAGLRPDVRHLAATAATLTDPRTHYDLSRVGAGLVGIDSSGTATLRPAMTLTAPVVSVRAVPAGTRVGYGHEHTTAHATRLALLPLGYADGIPRVSSDHGQVLIGGHRRPVVGLVSMDQVVIDVGRLPVRPGDVVTLIGPGDHGEPTPADWARWSSTIEHEVVTGIGARVPRLVLTDATTDTLTGSEPGHAPSAFAATRRPATTPEEPR